MSDFENSKKLHEDMELNSCCWYKRKLSVPAAADSSAQDIDRKKLPLAVKIFGALCIAAALFGLVGLGESIWSAVEMLRHGTAPQIGLSSIVVVFVRLFDLALLAVAYMIIGVRLLRNQRRYAAIMLYAVYVLLILGALCSLMLYGMDPRLILYDVLLVLMICFQVYLDPGLAKSASIGLRNTRILCEKNNRKARLGATRPAKAFSN